LKWLVTLTTVLRYYAACDVPTHAMVNDTLTSPLSKVGSRMPAVLWWLHWHLSQMCSGTVTTWPVEFLISWGVLSTTSLQIYYCSQMLDWYSWLYCHVWCYKP